MNDLKPILKWAGGKRQLLPDILPLVPDGFSTYCEPFIGGGAVFLSLAPKKAIINDQNEELVNVYRVVKENVEELIEDLKKHKNEAEYFYSIRSLDRDRKAYENLSNVERASRIIYLNKTCYNGLYRVNSHGELNAPFGRYKNPNIVNEEALISLSNYLNSAKITIKNGDYREAVKKLPQDSFVYFDPPYDPISETASFTSYTQNGFTKQNQIELRETCDKLTKRGIKFLLSNSDTPFIREQYSSYTISIVKAKRAINANGANRGAVNEVLISNYEYNIE